MASAAMAAPLASMRGGVTGVAKQRRHHSRRRPAVVTFSGAVKDDDDGVPQHRAGGFGEKLKGFFTEVLVRVPTSFVVERVLAPLYPETDCGPGRYQDPGTNSCVFMCREGYAWDAETKSCKLVVSNPGARAAMVNEHVPAVGRKPQMGKSMQPPKAPGALPDKLERRFYARDDDGALDGVIRWCVNRLVGVKKEEECRVGFFYDKVTRTCTPICKPGYVYDPVLKKCFKAEEALRS